MGLKQVVIFSGALAAATVFAASGTSACEGMTISADNLAALARCIKGLQADIAQLAKQVATLQTQLNHMNSAQSTVAVRRLGPATGPTGALGISLGSGTVQCPPGSWVSGIQGFRTDAVADLPPVLRPLGELRYSCRPLR